MNAVSLGPLVLSGERFAILAGVFVFIIGTGLLATRVSPRFNLWSSVVAFGGIAAARLGHVLTHWEYFQDDPWRALAVWQGGFSWIWAVPVIIAAMVVLLRTRQERAWALAPLAVGALVWTTAYQLVSATEPLPPPHLTLSALEGPPVDLSAVDGRPVVINLWATWCPPCRREMPALAQAQIEHPDVRFLFINQGEGDVVVRRFLTNEDLNLQSVLFDTAMEVPRNYRTVGIPVTLFLHADGRLAKAHLGEIAPEQIATEIARLN